MTVYLYICDPVCKILTWELEGQKLEINKVKLVHHTRGFVEDLKIYVVQSFVPRNRTVKKNQ